MISYHGDPAIKAKYIARVVAHREADSLIRGTGWDGSRGCAVGCTLEAYDHSRYPIELGIPEWAARLEDSIFESIPVEEAMLWPQKFLEAVPVGMTGRRWEDVYHRLSIKRLLRLVGIRKVAIGDKWGVVSALEQTIQYHQAPSISAAESAISAARSAAESAAESAISAVSAARSARSARSAAESAARSAWSAAESAAWSAWSAAESAAWSVWSAAESAAWSAAESAAWRQEAKDFLDTIEEMSRPA